MATTLSQSAWQYPYDTYKHVYLENTTAGHRKFYSMTNANDGNGSWTAVWGKIGTNGQSMSYNRGDWSDKLTEKIKKGYVITEAISLGTASKGKGTPPPVVNPRKSDILIDEEISAKIDRIVLFLDEKKDVSAAFIAEDIKNQYVTTGILTKEDMETLNRFWTKNGGGRW